MKVIVKPHSRETVEKIVGNGLAVAGEQIMNDCNFYAKRKDGDLIGSSSINIVNRTQIAIHWSTPYAARQYYTGKPSHEHNPNATIRWAEKAKKQYGKDWQKAIEEGMKL